MSTIKAKTIAVQNSAGTAKSDITFDGAKLVSTAPFDSLGVGQTWQDVTASRNLGVTYTNTTGKPISVAVVIGTNVINNGNVATIVVDGVSVTSFSLYSYADSSFFIVPAGSTYAINNTSGNATKNKWSELR